MYTYTHFICYTTNITSLSKATDTLKKENHPLRTRKPMQEEKDLAKAPKAPQGLRTRNGGEKNTERTLRNGTEAKS